MEREREILSERAFLTADTRGRDHPYMPCANRTEFQRDRDRIIHSFAFRRLMHKTQVFLSPADDSCRTRMTHTLEVSQIARIMARALRLNEDLCEAVALGHDIGHTPFGHAGESAMRKCYSDDFRHYKQSLRVVERLERNGAGLNLTAEVRDGILSHSGDNLASTLEGILVKYADRIAYINHDIEDACRSGILSQTDIPARLRELLGGSHSERVNTMVTAVIDASRDAGGIQMTPEVYSAMMELREFLFERVYNHKTVKTEENKAQELIIRLYEYYMENPEKMPPLYVSMLADESAGRCVCDYISGMTDRYAVELYRELYVPRIR